MAVIRLLAGEHNTSYRIVHTALRALEHEFGFRLDPRELISYEGRFDRPICAVCNCSGCLPECAYREDGSLREEYNDIKPGAWMSFTNPVNEV